jgi:hypothetical protein
MVSTPMKRPHVATVHTRDDDMKKAEQKVEAKALERDERPQRRTYQPPRIVKKRAVSRATLFTGSGPDSGGVVSA